VSILGWLGATALIAAFSVALVYIDPLSRVADWWEDRR
jgi:hypothetical protein